LRCGGVAPAGALVVEQIARAPDPAHGDVALTPTHELNTNATATPWLGFWLQVLTVLLLFGLWLTR
jgi:hypothetical protein